MGRASFTIMVLWLCCVWPWRAAEYKVKDLVLLKKHRETFTGPAQYSNKVKECKMRSAYDSNMRRLEVCPVQSSMPIVNIFLSQHLEQVGFGEQECTMPPGSFESHILDLMSGEGGSIRKGWGRGTR